MTTTANKNKTSVGLKGSVGGLSITAGGMHKDAGVSVATSLMGATVKVAASSIYSAIYWWIFGWPLERSWKGPYSLACYSQS